jgi:hypothetical protein
VESAVKTVESAVARNGAGGTTGNGIRCENNRGNTADFLLLFQAVIP